ncbi:MAG: energy transducer TonB [Planctomycetes bacterium]|nr:energy transducer TonB [Planctomycetota bacterium]
MTVVEVIRSESGVVRVFRGTVVTIGAIVLTLACFLVLPLLEAIAQPDQPDLTLVPIDTAALPPPPPVEPPQEEEKKESDEKPPDLADDAPPLDLAQLETALGGGGGDGSGSLGEFVPKLAIAGVGGADDAAFSLKDLDQKPRPIHDPAPVLTAALRKRRPATVTVLFVVDPSGRVENPIVQSSSDPSFEGPVLTAIRQWKFEPGKRGGRPVRSPMRQQFKFEG